MQLVWQSTVREDGHAYTLARILKKDSNHNMVIPASGDFSSITRNVRLKSDGSEVVSPVSLTPSAVILAALSTGNIWTRDTTGFNFIDLVPATAFPNKATTFLEYKFTMTDGVVFFIVVECYVSGVLSS